MPPYQVESPLAAAIGAGAGFMGGQMEGRQQAYAMNRQKQLDAIAATTAMIKNYADMQHTQNETQKTQFDTGDQAGQLRGSEITKNTAEGTAALQNAATNQFDAMTKMMLGNQTNTREYANMAQQLAIAKAGIQKDIQLGVLKTQAEVQSATIGAMGRIQASANMAGGMMGAANINNQGAANRLMYSESQNNARTQFGAQTKGFQDNASANNAYIKSMTGIGGQWSQGLPADWTSKLPYQNLQPPQNLIPASHGDVQGYANQKLSQILSGGRNLNDAFADIATNNQMMPDQKRWAIQQVQMGLPKSMFQSNPYASQGQPIEQIFGAQPPGGMPLGSPFSGNH